MINFLKSFLFKSRNIIFIHGITSNKSANPILEKAAKKKFYNYYALDLPMHGDNNDPVEDISLESYVQYVKKFILENKIKKPILYGHSMGGGIAICLLNEMKDYKFKKIILENPLNGSVYDSYNEKIKLSAKKLFSINYKEAINEFKSYAKLLKDLSSNEKRVYFIKLLKNISSKKSLDLIDNSYKNIDIKIFLMIGENDEIIPSKKSLEHLLKLNNKTKYKIFPNANHSISKNNVEEYYKSIVKFI